ncbi:benzoate 4-monooxygenase cytochrome p450 [Colletotrichum plurivorum]|uniref:Benzoate 4-monooxygenase cytochrome p450 n=1 Tax=Colletotrichum plurivorum TaxID=2175906 RepID=A0A8H6KJI6_9PEZI|nr:benzoate 4-monooxygenase cytochrome p450 [Colletotrichum plurivorum]
MLCSPTVAAFICVLLLYLIVSKVRSHAQLKHIPGPAIAGWTDGWLMRHTLGGRLPFTLKDAHKKHGRVVRVAPNWVVCGDGMELRRLWAARSPWKRAPWYRGLRFDPWRDSTFSAVDDKFHDHLRSKVAAGYAGKDVDGVQDAIDEQVAGLVNLLETKYLSSDDSSGSGCFRPVDLARKVQFFTLDVISSIGFGKKFGYLDADADAFRYIEITETLIPTLLVITLQTWILDILQSRVVKYLAPDSRGSIGIGEVMSRAQEAVKERYGPNAVRRRDILGSFVAHGLTMEEAEGETVVQILAGSDTTATAIRATMLFIMTNHGVYARLREEIDTAAAEGRISSPITDAEARKMPYLQAIIREGIRYWPPATGLLPKVCDKDELVCGVRIPAGTNVAWSPFAVMRDVEVFGPDAEVFRPERWIGVSPDKYRSMEAIVMLDFAGGSRWECLGRNIAMMELNKVFVELLRRFDFAIVNPTKPWLCENYAVWIQKELNVKVTRRAFPV